MRVLPKEKWDYLFPIAASVYTYEQFVKAVHKFPAVCGEKDSSINLSLDEVCKKELATIFAHMVQETGAHSPGGYMGV